MNHTDIVLFETVYIHTCHPRRKFMIEKDEKYKFILIRDFRTFQLNSEFT